MAKSLKNRKCLETGKTTLNRESVLPYHVFNAQPLVRRDDRSSWANIPLMKVRPFLHMAMVMMFLTMMIIRLVMMFLTMMIDEQGYLRLPAVASILSNFQPTFWYCHCHTNNWIPIMIIQKRLKYCCFNSNQHHHWNLPSASVSSTCRFLAMNFSLKDKQYHHSSSFMFQVSRFRI